MGGRETVMKAEAVLSTGIRLDTLGSRIRQERVRKSLSLDALARQAKVSRSMLSAVERGEKVPSVLVLDQIAAGLGTTISRLIGEHSGAENHRVVLLPKASQDAVQDPAGWRQRVLSPVLPKVDFEFVRASLGPRAHAGAYLPHNPGSREYVAVERGTLRLILDGDEFVLHKGDSIYFAGDCLHAFENPHPNDICEYYLAMDVTGHPEQLRHRVAPPELARLPKNGAVREQEAEAVSLKPE